MKYLMGFILLISISCNKKAKQNYNDLKKIEIGMHYKMVDTIMKLKPIEITDAYWNDSLFVLKYSSGPTASDDYQIIFSKNDSLVVEIYYGD